MTIVPAVCAASCLVGRVGFKMVAVAIAPALPSGDQAEAVLTPAL
jgi:hypothetical protein